jgi:Holliday junction resolvase
MILPKRLNQKQHPSVQRSAIQERQAANRLGGSVTRGSGSGAHDKGDVQIKGLAKVECKTTQYKSFSVTADLIDKIESHALQAGELPVMEIEIDNAGKPRTVYVMPQWAVDMLLQRVAENDGAPSQSR